MKRIIIGIVLVAVIVIIGAPFVNGLIMERIVRQSYSDVNKLAHDTDSGVSLEVVRYDRGYRASEIEWKIKLGSYKKIYGVDEIVFVERAKHQLTGVVSNTSLERNKWFNDLVDARFEGKNPIDITTRYSMTGTIESTLVVDGFSMQLDGEKLDVKPGRLVVSVEKGLTVYSNEISWEGATVDDAFFVDGVSLVSRMEKITPYIWDGAMSFKINDFKIDDSLTSQEHAFELVNASSEYTFDFVEENKTLSLTSTLGAERIIGSGDQVDDASIKFEVHHLDAQAFEEYMKTYMAIVHEVLQQLPATAGDEEAMERALKNQMSMAAVRMVAASEKFLKKDLEIRVPTLYARLSEGEVKGRMLLRLNEDITYMQLVPVLNRPALAFELLQLESELSIPAALVKAPSDLVSPLHPSMQTGLFVRDKDNLRHQAEIQDKKLILNGLEVVL